MYVTKTLSDNEEIKSVAKLHWINYIIPILTSFILIGLVLKNKKDEIIDCLNKVTIVESYLKEQDIEILKRDGVKAANTFMELIKMNFQVTESFLL